MSANSKIEWTERTWNPLAGCTPISPGCTNCYAATMAKRLEAMGQAKYAGTAERRGKTDVFTGKINLGDEDSLKEPLHWKKPRMVFVNSMSDLFHEAVPIAFIARAFAIMVDTPRHTYQVLTKRADRMAVVMNTPIFWRVVRQWMKGNHIQLGDEDSVADSPMPQSNIWLGTSCEDQNRADERIPELLKCPAAVRFLSCEPLLGPINIDKYLWPFDEKGRAKFTFHSSPEPHGSRYPLGLIKWVICGGESGPNARPMQADWARSLRDQCVAAGVPYFFKQWGEWCPANLARSEGCVDRTNGKYHFEFDPQCNGELKRLGKKLAGRILDGRTWDQFPKPSRTDTSGRDVTDLPGLWDETDKKTDARGSSLGE